MTKSVRLLLAILTCILGMQGQATAQCPNPCTINLPASVQSVSDTLHLDSIPNGQKNVPYDESTSFRLPHTAGSFGASGIPANVTINSVTIKDVANLPPGLSYQLDKALPAVYDNASPTPRDGCVRICGTPTQSGVFKVTIKASVNVFLLGNVDQDIDLDFIVETDSVDTGIHNEALSISTCKSAGKTKQVECSLKVYPNPTRADVNVSFDLHDTPQVAQISIANLLGQTLYQEQLNDFGGNYNNNFSLDNFAKGVYLLRIRVGDELVNRKIVLQ